MTFIKKKRKATVKTVAIAALLCEKLLLEMFVIEIILIVLSSVQTSEFNFHSCIITKSFAKVQKRMCKKKFFLTFFFKSHGSLQIFDYYIRKFCLFPWYLILIIVMHNIPTCPCSHLYFGLGKSPTCVEMFHIFYFFRLRGNQLPGYLIRIELDRSIDKFRNIVRKKRFGIKTRVLLRK